MGYMDFSISERGETGGATVFNFRGDITAAHGRMLRAFFIGLPSTGVKCAVIDMSDVNYMASVGIGELVHAHHLLRDGGGGLALANLTQRIRDLLKLSRMDTVLTIRPTIDEAVAVLTAPPVPPAA